MNLRRLLQSKGAAAAILVTAATLLLIGGVLAVTTTLGCGPANGVGLKLASCIEAGNTSGHFPITPTPSVYPVKGNQYPPPYNSPATNYPPYNNPGSSYPPYNNAGSSYPPYNNPGSSYPPYTNPATGTTDPFFPPSSGSPPAHPLSCSLPIYAGPAGSGGFIVFPQGNFVADPRSAVALPSPNPGAPSPGYLPGPGYGAGPGGYGYGMAWDSKHSRWLPVRAEWVAPDGSHYAYPSTNSVYLVAASTNTQVELGSGHAWSVVRVLNDRVYATIPSSPGFWVLTYSGTPRQVTAQGYWQAATQAAAYGTLISAVPQGAPTKIVKLDISSGTVTDWFTRENANSSVFGFDLQGNPLIISSYTNGWALWLTKSPTDAQVIANNYQGFWTQGPPFADGNGVWIPAYYNQYGQSGAGVVLYVAGSGLYWMASIGGQLAGGCA